MLADTTGLVTTLAIAVLKLDALDSRLRALDLRLQTLDLRLLEADQALPVLDKGVNRKAHVANFALTGTRDYIQPAAPLDLHTRTAICLYK